MHCTALLAYVEEKNRILSEDFAPLQNAWMKL